MTDERPPDARLLLVEDEPDQRRLLAERLVAEGYAVATAGSFAAAQLELERAPIDCVISDWKLPDGDGAELLALVRARYPESAFVMVTAYGTIARAVEAIRAGADDYLTKPFERQALLLAVTRTLERRRLARENRRLAEELVERDRLVDLVGRSAAMQALFARVEKLAATDATVLLTGESGTGKELAARALHRLSSRSTRAFVAVNCAAVPEGLLEAEFFGVERGAFTGAERTRAGRFELAHGGTLFLDEVGELPPALQPKLLRALQEGRVTHVGGQRELAVDVRVVAASNRDLAAEVAAGRFRQDLYYRLAVVPLELPPLRARREDVPLLAKHFAARAARRHGVPLPVLSPAVLRRLIEYSWPGNARELANVVERLVVLAEDRHVRLEDLPDEVAGREAPPAPESSFRLPAGGVRFEQVERDLLRQALALAAGNRARAARLLDLPYKAFLYRLERLGLE